MVKSKYNTTIKNEKKIAKAMLVNVPASVKFLTEYSNQLKGMKLDKAEALVKDILEQKRFLPLRRYNRKVPHRKGIAQNNVKSGKFPFRTSQILLGLLTNVKANADYKGLDASNLIIEHMFASHGYSRTSHQKQGRISGKMHQRKSAHVEVVVREAK